MKIISNARYFENDWHAQYQRLAKRFEGLLPSKKGEVVEIGCGKGQLTIPLSKLVPDCSIIAVDKFASTNSKNYELLRSALARENLDRRIRIIVSDYMGWLSKQASHKYDGLISSEFLSEIDSTEMDRFLSECHRVLKIGGVTIHGFLSSQAKNSQQRLLIEADSDPKWTKFPPKEWFSPQPRLVAGRLRHNGFSGVQTFVVKSNLRIKANAARKLLRGWDVRATFWRFHQRQLAQEGLEIPN